MRVAAARLLLNTCHFFLKVLDTTTIRFARLSRYCCFTLSAKKTKQNVLAACTYRYIIINGAFTPDLLLHIMLLLTRWTQIDWAAALSRWKAGHIEWRSFNLAVPHHYTYPTHSHQECSAEVVPVARFTCCSLLALHTLMTASRRRCCLPWHINNLLVHYMTAPLDVQLRVQTHEY